MTEPRTRRVSKALLVVISLIVIAATVVIVAGIHLSNPYLRKKAVEMLSEKFHADVELKDFHVYLFPGARIEGSGLVLRHEEPHRCPTPDFYCRIFRRGGHSGIAREAVENRAGQAQRA